jgi:hypothetical protein
MHRAVEAAGWIIQWASDSENSPPQHVMGFNPQETFTQHDEARYVHDGIGIQIMELNSIGKKEVRGGIHAKEKRAHGGRMQERVLGIPQVAEE